LGSIKLGGHAVFASAIYFDYYLPFFRLVLLSGVLAGYWPSYESGVATDNKSLLS